MQHPVSAVGGGGFKTNDLRAGGGISAGGGIGAGGDISAGGGIGAGGGISAGGDISAGGGIGAGGSGRADADTDAGDGDYSDRLNLTINVLMFYVFMTVSFMCKLACDINKFIDNLEKLKQEWLIGNLEKLIDNQSKTTMIERILMYFSCFCY